MRDCLTIKGKAMISHREPNVHKATRTILQTG